MVPRGRQPILAMDPCSRGGFAGALCGASDPLAAMAYKTPDLYGLCTMLQIQLLANSW